MALLVADILTALTDTGEIGGATGWTGYAGILPDVPDKVVAIFEFSLGGPGQDDVSPIYEYPGIQIRVRGEAYGGQDVLAKIDSVVRKLENQSPNRFVYLHGKDGGPFFLRIDKNDRPEYAWNMASMSEVS